MPSFIWRPSSLAGPENGDDMPNRISVSVTPRLAAPDLASSGLVAASAGDVSVALGREGCGTAGAGATTVGSERAWPGGVSDCVGVTVFSRSASARSAATQVRRLLATARWPSVWFWLYACHIADDSSAVGAVTVIRSASVSLMDLTRSGEISRQAAAEPSTRPTAAAIWRTASTRSLAGAEYPTTGTAMAMAPSKK